MSIPKAFAGTWKMIERDENNYNNYLAEIKVSWKNRFFAKKLSRKLEITITSDDSIELPCVPKQLSFFNLKMLSGWADVLGRTVVDQIDTQFLPVPILPTYEKIIINEKFKQTRKDGVEIELVYELSKNCIICHQRNEDFSSKSVWKIKNSGDELEITLECNNVSAKQLYKKVLF